MTITEKLSNYQSDERRKKLRLKRTIKFLQSVWRLLFLTGVSGGLFWTMRLPYWHITTDQQMNIVGNQLMETEDIHGLISLNYPQYLWQMNTEEIIEKLESSQPIKEARVTRQLFPTQVNIYVEERQPVAIVVSPKLNQATASPSRVLLGFIDREGVFILEDFYPQVLNKSILPEPILTVIGYNKEYQAYWKKIQQFIQQSSVKFFSIEWRSNTAILLTTERGNFYLGNYPTQIEEQLAVITKMPPNPEEIDMTKVEYIDLSNPDLPSVKFK